jgi:pilus assembly protein CpaD
MTTTVHALPAIALALFAGACQSYGDRYEASLPVEQRLPIEVSSEVALLDVETDGRGRLTGSSHAAVEAFVRRYKSNGIGALEIQVADGGRQNAAAEGQIRDLASTYGIQRSQVALTAYRAPATAPGSLRLAFASYVASVPKCDSYQDWSQDLAVTVNNTPYPAFGCATQQNIAAMAADPRDLVEARPMDPRDSGRRGVVVDKYRKGEETKAQSTSQDGAKVSDVQ